MEWRGLQAPLGFHQSSAMRENFSTSSRLIVDEYDESAAADGEEVAGFVVEDEADVCGDGGWTTELTLRTPAPPFHTFLARKRNPSSGGWRKF